MQCSCIPSHRNNLFLHQRKEAGRPVIGSVDNVFGANVAVRGVDDVVVDREPGGCMYSWNDEYILSSLERIPATSHYGCIVPPVEMPPAHPVHELQSSIRAPRMFMSAVGLATSTLNSGLGNRYNDELYIHPACSIAQYCSPRVELHKFQVVRSIDGDY